MAAPALKVQLQGVTTVSSDNLNTYIQSCDTIAQLRGFVGADGVQVFVRGLTAPNDGGAGEFYWDDAATGPDNGVNVIVPTGSALGAWIRLVINGIDAVGTYSFATTVALLAAFAPTVVLASGTVAFTAGRTTEGDSGGGEFFYDAADTTTADNGGTIRVDAAGRRWYAVANNNILPELFGAIGNGSHDDSAALNLAFVGAAALGQYVYGSGKTYKCNETLTWDQSLTSFDMNGSVLDFTGLTVGPAINLFTTATDPNLMSGIHNKRPFGNGNIYGPAQSTGIYAVTCTPKTISALPWFVGTVFENISYTGFGAFLQIGNGMSFQRLSNVFGIASNSN